MPPLQSTARPFPDLVEESFDEAAFLWSRWESELSSPTRNLDEVWSWTEDRLQGALDGVRVAGTGVVDVCVNSLMSDELDRVVIGAAVLASSSERNATDAIAAALSVGAGERLRAMVRALELLGSDPALRAAASVLLEGGAVYAGALCRLKAFRRVAGGDEILTALRSNVPSVQIDALRAAVYVPPRAGEEWISPAMHSADPTVRYAAVECGLYCGIDGAWDTAKRFGRQLDANSGSYLKLLAMLGTGDEHEGVYEALRIPELQTQAIGALGHIGTVRAAEACLAGMQHEKLARACGEAYCWITGADLVRDRLAAKEPSFEVPPFEEDDLDANLVPSPESLWPLPDPEAARRHWVGRRTDFAANVRHVHGKPAARETLLAMVETGPMLRRPDLILELRARSRGKYDVEPRAFRARQRQMMASARSALAG